MIMCLWIQKIKPSKTIILERMGEQDLGSLGALRGWLEVAGGPV